MSREDLRVADYLGHMLEAIGRIHASESVSATLGNQAASQTRLF